MTAPVPPRPFNYDAAMVELRDLVHRARSFSESDEHHDAPEFRRWRHDLRDLMARLSQIRYSLNTAVSQRQFRAMRTQASPTEDRAVFNRDLTDTTYELDLIIANYEKYGDPKASLKPVPQHPGVVSAPIVEPVSATLKGRVQTAFELTPDPNRIAQVFAKIAPAKLVPPENLTLRWIIDHLTVGGWAKLIVVLGAAVSIGIAIGASPVTQALLTRWLGL